MRLAVVLTLAAVSAGCSSSTPIQSTPTPETVRVNGGSAGAISLGMVATAPDARATTISAPLDAVWSVMPAAFESLAIPLSNIDPATHVIGNAGFNVHRRLGSVPLVRLIDCGTTQGGPSAETYDIRLIITTQVRAVEGGTSLSTTVEPMGRPAAFSGEYIRCSSTGSLETRLADAVKSRLGK